MIAVCVEQPCPRPKDLPGQGWQATGTGSFRLHQQRTAQPQPGPAQQRRQPN